MRGHPPSHPLSSPPVPKIPVRERLFLLDSHRSEGLGYPSRKTSVLVPEGKPRTFLVRGFSITHATDSEAYLPSRAFLVAEHHMTGLKGRNLRQATLWCREWLRNRCVSESFRLDGSAPEARRIGRNSLRRRTGALSSTVLWSLRVLSSFGWTSLHARKGRPRTEGAAGYRSA